MNDLIKKITAPNGGIYKLSKKKTLAQVPSLGDGDFNYYRNYQGYQPHK